MSSIYWIMWLYSLLGTLATLLVCVESASISATSDPDTFQELSLKPEGAATDRLLRSADTSDELSENRVTNAGIEKITNLFKTGVTKTKTSGQHSADEILKKFKLENGIEEALVSLNLKAMGDYVKDLNSKNRFKKTSMIRLFTKYYGDDVVAKALSKVQGSAHSADAVDTIKQLRMEQLTAWLKSKKSVDDVFKLLKLRDDSLMAFVSPKMAMLDDYIKLFNREKSSGKTLAKTLVTGFGESQFVSLLQLGLKNSYTKDLATSLETELVNLWLASKFKPGDIMKKLKLDEDMGLALANQSRQSRELLTRYISVYNQRYPNSKTSLVATFTARYGDDVVAETLYMARQAPDSKRLAIDLQKQQYMEWQKSGKSADDVFKALKVKVEDFATIISPKLESLYEYIKILKTNDLRGAPDDFTVVRSGLGGDGDLARMLVRSFTVSDALNMDAASSMATVYEKKLFKRWTNDSIEPKTIYSKFLNVEETSANTWEKAFASRYASYFEKKTFSSNLVNFNDPRRL
ncbi:hypothetical protein F444_14915 [Phytophthora nicotianae P1976]|uniref:RxLR effector protein n=1 Tax=Phytophthora nicotianae P1976 TaxID=1317066 RepID=A0A080ZNL8_PHYNI|nr:hypothetical protein F444_14915 [Phytophthora nicotianae P1976]